MTHDGHPRELDRLRLALWGAVDAATRDGARHVDGGCEPCARDVQVFRRARQALGAVSMPHRGALLRVRAAARELLEPVMAVNWVRAQPALLGAGVRAGVTADRQLVCRVGDRHLDALVHPVGVSGAFAVSGQLLDAGDMPAAGVTVALLVGGGSRATTRTNGFGEFEFDEHRGRHFGLRIGDGGGATHVELWTAEGVQ